MGDLSHYFDIILFAMVAAARSRCPVLPLNPDAPQARRQTMLDDARPAVLLHETGDDTLTVEPLAPRPRPDTASLPPYEMRDVAYIMYTSGSTGRPKGVVVPHDALLSRLEALARVPGFGPEDLFRELRPLAGEDVELEVIRYDEYPAQPDMALFDTLGEILRELAPTARPMPLLLPGVTDARFFARLGIQTYGFLPMQLPQELPFMQLIHAAAERIPSDSLEFGTQAISRVLERFV